MEFIRSTSLYRNRWNFFDPIMDVLCLLTIAKISTEVEIEIKA